MVDKTLSSVVGGGGAISLAPDLTRLGTLLTSNNFVRVTGIDTVGAPTEVLGLTGRYVVGHLKLFNATAESVTITLDIDGETIYSETFTMLTTLTIYSDNSPFVVNSSLSLKVEMAADTSIDFDYIARPII